MRDPKGVLPAQQLQEGLRLDAELPRDASASGYENDGWELWFASSDNIAAAYLVSEGGEEVVLWPRDTTDLGCD